MTNQPTRFDFFAGEAVNQLWFWGQTRLVFDQPSGRPWYVDVQRVRLIDADGTATQIDAAGAPLKLAPMLGLLKRVVTDASAEDGVLRLRFEGGFTLEALPDNQYESWTVAGPNGVTQCLPAGEIGSW